MDEKGFVFVVSNKGKKHIFRESNISRLVRNFPESDVEVFDTCSCKPLGVMKPETIVSKFL